MTDSGTCAAVTVAEFKRIIDSQKPSGIREIADAWTKKVPTTLEYVRKLQSIGVSDPEDFAYEYKAVGCESCENTGYKGRVGIYELLLVEGQVRDAIHSGLRSEDILSIARSRGFRCESCSREVMATFVYCPFCSAPRGPAERTLVQQ